MKVLRVAGAETGKVNGGGKSALIEASKERHIEVVEVPFKTNLIF
jgi:hypothetical protein